ncbi:unnamed protein product [Larinioides sclopetarius]|uniref:Uncharacterized protein n=1 Tax=Larinioides sclopetarius TaxID=280406 RepID=A0AAV2AJE7_9ARAC
MQPKYLQDKQNSTPATSYSAEEIAVLSISLVGIMVFIIFLIFCIFFCRKFQCKRRNVVNVPVYDFNRNGRA